MLKQNYKIYDSQTSMCSDECWKDSKTKSNEEISNYYTYNTNFAPCNEQKVKLPDFYLDHENLRPNRNWGHVENSDQLKCDNVDVYNNLVNNKELMTHDKCKLQIFERLFTACPSIRGSEGDISKELDVISGSDTNTLRCKKTIMEQPLYKFDPLLDCVKEVQNPKHIVPEWVNGGEDTRSYINRLNYNKKC